MATIERIRPLVEQLKGNPWLMGLMANHGNRAAEKETMIAQTIRACVHNYADTGEAFSFKGAGVHSFAGNGLVDNGTAYGYLVREGYFTEANRGGRETIEPTDKLLDLLEEYFSK